MTRTHSRTVDVLLLFVVILAVACSDASGAEQPAPLVYVSNEQSGDLSVIDSATDTVVATIPVGKRPRGLAISPDNKTVYVALSGSPVGGPGVKEVDLPPADKKADGIGVVDAGTRKLVRKFKSGSDPENFTISRDGALLYISNEDDAKASVLDVASGNIIATVEVTDEPEGVTLSPDAKLVYITCESRGEVFVMDTKTNTITTQFKTGERPRSVAVLPDNSRLYVPSENGGTINVYSIPDYKEVAKIAPEGQSIRPMGTVLTRDGKTLFASTGHGGVVAVIDTASNKVTTEIKVGKRPWGVALTPDGRKLYVANGQSNNVSVIDTETLKLIKNITVGDRPWGVAITGNAK